MPIKWTNELRERLKQLVIAGDTAQNIANKLSGEYQEDITCKSIEAAKHRCGLTGKYLEEDNEVKIYKELTLPQDDYIVFCDTHSPYHNVWWLNMLVAVADKLLPKDKPKKAICVGDLFEMDFAKYWYSDEPTTLDQEAERVEPVIKLLDYFDKVWLVTGNHERRVGRMTDAKIQAKHIYRIFGKEIWDKKFMVTEYDKLSVGDKWLLVHPRSYSQISLSVARRLAEKYHRNIINSHGHLLGSGYDRSGEYQCIDLGGTFDRNKIEYISKHTTAHPVWKNGFGLLRANGKLTHFTESTDWGLWGL